MNKKGQAVTEFAIFGLIIIFTFGVMVAYLMRMNDQQYVEQEAFRRALEKACTYQGKEADTSGASVQLDLIEHRRYPKMYEKVLRATEEGAGSQQLQAEHPEELSSVQQVRPDSVEASSSVFWAVSKVEPQQQQQGQQGAGGQGGSLEPQDLLVLRANEDEKIVEGGGSVPDISYFYDTQIEDVLTKQETDGTINTTKTTKTTEKVTTDFSDVWSVEQGLYRDENGQYKYSEQALQGGQAETVERSKKWETGN